MDLSSNNYSIAATSLQQSHLPGTVLYSSKETGWQPVVTSIPLIPMATTEIPKESIIANTDFTTTSAIARRRLSSKKKRKQSRDDSTSPHNTSPTDTTNRQDLSMSYPSSTSLAHHLPSNSSSHHICTMQQGVSGATPINVPVPIRVLHHQHNPVFNQVPSEILYKMFQQEPVPVMSSPGSTVGHTPHQLQYVESSTGQHLSYSISAAALNQLKTTPSQQQVKEMSINSNNTDLLHKDQLARQYQQLQQQQIQQQQLQQHQMQQQMQQQIQQQQLHHQLQLQQQQQLAMMQLYRSHGMVSGPVTLSGLHQLQLQGGVPVVGHTPHQPHPNQLISVPIQTVYPQHHSVPMATTLAPPELLVQVQNGSWVAPTAATPMFGPCIVNPIQPGLLTTSLVK